MHLPRGSLALWVRVAEAFCGLKTGSPGSALKVLGLVHPCRPQFDVLGRPLGPGAVQVEAGESQLGCLALGTRDSHLGRRAKPAGHPSALGCSAQLAFSGIPASSFPFILPSPLVEAPGSGSHCQDGPQRSFRK